LAVLERSSLLSHKAINAAMLAVTKAGSRLVAVGERGIVLLSDDAGENWRQVETPVRVSLTAVQFTGPQMGWAVGHLGVILHTTDGGQTWTKQLDGRQVAQMVLADAQRRAEASLDPEEKDDILYVGQRFADDGPDKPFLNLYFLNERSGFVFGAFNMILRTDDGGDTWTPWGGRVENPMELHLYGMCTLGETLWLAGEQGLLLRSDDGGEHFSEADSPYAGSYFGIMADAGGDLVLYGLRGNVYRSSDGGQSWQKIDTGTLVSFSAGIPLAGGGLALVSQAGDLLTSPNGDRRLQPYPKSVPVPATGLVQTGDAGFVVASLRGMHRIQAQ
jgi:photosystem II stability/assembly factor-like uncharacterized protein